MTKKNRNYLSKNDNNSTFYDKYPKITQKLASIGGKEKIIILRTGTFSVSRYGYELNLFYRFIRHLCFSQ